MTASKLIEEMDELPPEEQAKVIHYAFELARHRQLSAAERGRPEAIASRKCLPLNLTLEHRAKVGLARWIIGR